MTFEKVFNLTDNMSHKERYTTIINGLGYERVKECIPFDHETIVEALKTDEHLNNLPLRTWETAAGFVFNNGDYINRCSALRQLCREKGVKIFSSSELVCILKNCAAMWAKETEPEVKKKTNDYLEMTARHQKEWNNFPMFFAFNDKQFAEGMKKLGLNPKDTKKIYRLSDTGGYYRKSDAAALREMIDRQNREMEEAIASDTDGTGFAFDMFYYELSNHEYCITYDISETLNALGYESINEVKKNEQLFKALENARARYLEEYNM